ncbi:hypothetical protein [Deinococcus peraridilitoris]|nr:hypothetical protein [Deinococcus peraridilitoris]
MSAPEAAEEAYAHLHAAIEEAGARGARSRGELPVVLGQPGLLVQFWLLP